MTLTKTKKVFIIKMLVSIIILIIGIGLIATFSKEQKQKKKEINRTKTVKYVFKDETYCEISVITSDLPEDSVLEIVNELYPDESEMILIKKIDVEIENQE